MAFLSALPYCAPNEPFGPHHKTFPALPDRQRNFVARAVGAKNHHWLDGMGSDGLYSVSGLAGFFKLCTAFVFRAVFWGSG